MATVQRTSAGAKTLPAEFYVDEGIFAREQERIFSRRWLFAGHGSRIAEPGCYFTVEVAGESLIVARGTDSQVRAFFNVCRHRGARVCTEEEGRVGKALQCPYHAWTYGLDGTLLGAPNMAEVEGFRRQDHALAAVAVETWEGLVFVNLDAQPPPLGDELAPLVGRFTQWHISELVPVHRTIYDVEANWKLLFQNYSECYHCPTVHPMLNRLTPYRDSVNDLDEGPVLGGPMRLADGQSSMTMTGMRCGSPLGEVTGEDLQLIYYYTVFPNLFLSLHPDYVLIHRGEPLAVDRTRIVCEWYFQPEDVAREEFDPSPAIDFWDMTNRQDWHLCTISQQGIGSRAYRPGPYSNLESQLAAFDREYLRVLGVDPGEFG